MIFFPLFQMKKKIFEDKELKSAIALFKKIYLKNSLGMNLLTNL